jgi:hypothetical protein
MKLTNTQWVIVIAVVVIAVWYFFFKDKGTGKSDESSYLKPCPSGWDCKGQKCDGNWSKNPNTGEVMCKKGSRPGMIYPSGN